MLFELLFELQSRGNCLGDISTLGIRVPCFGGTRFLFLVLLGGLGLKDEQQTRHEILITIVSYVSTCPPHD